MKTMTRTSLTLGVAVVAGLIAARSMGEPAKVSPAKPAAVAPAAAAAPAKAAGPSVFDGMLFDGDANPEIGTRELQDAMKSGNVVVLDARPYEEFAVSHLPGAKTVPGLPGLTPAKYTSDSKEVIKLVPDKSRALVVYCNGLYCGRSKRFATDLKKAGYASVRRYQLGIPVWRALGGVTQVEKDTMVQLLKTDGTAVLIDARDSSTAAPKLARARWIPAKEAPKAKDDGRLPMTDHNTRIFVVADDGAKAREAAEGIVRDAFHNVSFYGGSIQELTALHEQPAAARAAK